MLRPASASKCSQCSAKNSYHWSDPKKRKGEPLTDRFGQVPMPAMVRKLETARVILNSKRKGDEFVGLESPQGDLGGGTSKE